MTEQWENLHAIPLEDGNEYQIIRKDNTLVIRRFIKEQPSEWVDITKECCIKTEQSTRNNGIFAILVHGETIISYFSPINATMKHEDKYKVELAKGATISFRVFMKNTVKKGVH
jgi:hypothetical protein